jgi:LacI family transcriptional regulator
VRRRADVLGIVVGDFTNPFHAEMAALLEQEAASHDYTTLLATTGGDAEVEAHRVELFLEQSVAAILFVAFSGHPRALGNLPRDTPCVFVSFHTPLGPSVAVDERQGAALATSHLLNLGHKRIGYVSTTLAAEPLTDEMRHEGYAKTLAGAGVALDESLVLQVGSAEVESALQEYLTRPDAPTAIFAASDYTALSIMDCADQLGLPIPGRLSLVGFDNISMAGLRRISLTTVAQPFGELARVGVKTALAAIEGEQPAPRRLAPRLIVRGSTAAPPSS